MADENNTGAGNKPAGLAGLKTQDQRNKEASAAGQGDNEGYTLFTSHPIANYAAGDYRFQNGVLRLKDDKVADFEKFLDDLPESERHKIKKLDVQGAETISRKFQAQNEPRATQQTDSTIGERGDKAHIGKGELKDSATGGAI